MVFRAISHTTVYVILCMSFSLAQDDGRWAGNYTIEELENLQEDIWDIAVSPHTGNVYLAYGHGDMYVIKNETSYKINIKFNVVAVAVDKFFEVVYIGCEKGIKKYNENTGGISKVLEAQTATYGLFLPKNRVQVYVLALPNQQVYLYQNLFTEKYKLNITISTEVWYCRFVVDSKGNIFYTTRENRRFVTKILLNGKHSPTVYDAGPFHSLAADDLGRVYGVPFSGNNLYRLKEDGSWPNKVATLDFKPRGMSFDKINDPVFATQDNKVVIFKFPNNAKL